MERLTQVAEITVCYKPKVKASDRPKISGSQDAYTLLMQVWNHDLIELQEQFYLLLLDKANKVKGYKLLSTGGSSGTVVDGKHVFAIALKTSAAGIILAHNHPSCSVQPSQADIELTNRLKKVGEFLDLPILDHLIISPDGVYYSFADQGTIGNGHANHRNRRTTTFGLPVDAM